MEDYVSDADAIPLRSAIHKLVRAAQDSGTESLLRRHIWPNSPASFELNRGVRARLVELIRGGASPDEAVGTILREVPG